MADEEDAIAIVETTTRKLNIVEERAERLAQIADTTAQETFVILEEIKKRGVNLTKVPYKSLVICFVMMARESLRLAGRADMIVDHRFQAVLDLPKDDFDAILASDSTGSLAKS